MFRGHGMGGFLQRVFDQRRARNTTRYRAARARFLAHDPLCSECGRKGIVKAAAELDHIEPAADAPDRFWAEDNWQGLCRECHFSKTATENRTHQPPPGQAEWAARMKCYD